MRNLKDGSELAVGNGRKAVTVGELETNWEELLPVEKKILPERLRKLGQSIKELNEEDIPEVSWVVPHLLTEGLTILGGYNKSGKSIIAMNIGVAVAEGGLVLGETKVDQGRVLYITPDDPHKGRIRARINKMRTTSEKDIPLDVYPHWLPLDIPDEDGNTGLSDLRTYLEVFPETKLVVIDVLMNVLPGIKEDANAYGEVYKRLPPLKALAQEKHVAVLVLMHTSKGDGKNSSNPRSAIYGSQAYGSVADNLFIIVEDYVSHQRSLATYGKDMLEETIGLEFDKDTGRYTYGEKRKEELQTITAVQGIGALVKSQPNMSFSMLRTILMREEGIGESAANMRITRALNKGEICKDGKTLVPCQKPAEANLEDYDPDDIS